MTDPVIITLKFSDDAKYALEEMTDHIKALKPMPGSKSDLTDAARQVYLDMIAEALAATETPIGWDRAQEIICTLKGGLHHSINGNSTLIYSANLAQGKTLYGAATKKNPYKEEFQALRDDLDAIITDHGFNYDDFEAKQKPLRKEHMRAQTLGDKQHDDRIGNRSMEQAARTYTRDDAIQTVTAAISNYKSVRQHNVPEEDEGLLYYLHVRDALGKKADVLSGADVKEVLWNAVTTPATKTEALALESRFDLGRPRTSWVSGL